MQVIPQKVNIFVIFEPYMSRLTAKQENLRIAWAAGKDYISAAAIVGTIMARISRPAMIAAKILLVFAFFIFIILVYLPSQ